ncbi:hypothetical protein RB195_012770 [Necator americanus]|uniref:Uncharacterized protein n=1 Tax=Necator americanus TaxID=51031 RepID=A0ABR1DSG4_NECAM
MLPNDFSHSVESESERKRRKERKEKEEGQGKEEFSKCHNRMLGTRENLKPPGDSKAKLMEFDVAVLQGTTLSKKEQN